MPIGALLRREFEEVSEQTSQSAKSCTTNSIASLVRLRKVNSPVLVGELMNHTPTGMSPGCELRSSLFAPYSTVKSISCGQWDARSGGYGGNHGFDAFGSFAESPPISSRMSACSIFMGSIAGKFFRDGLSEIEVLFSRNKEAAFSARIHWK